MRKGENGKRMKITKEEFEDKKPEEKVLEAALQIVKENTISGTRMHLIAERANMVQSNVHYYYKTKNELMLALQKKVLNRCKELRQKYEMSCADTLSDHLDVFFKQKEEFILNEKEYDYAELDFWVQCRTSEEIRSEFCQSFNGWREEMGEILDKYAPDLDTRKRRYIPYVFVSMLEGAPVQYLIDEGSFNIREYFAFCKERILQMIYES